MSGKPPLWPSSRLKRVFLTSVMMAEYTLPYQGLGPWVLSFTSSTLSWHMVLDISSRMECSGRTSENLRVKAGMTNLITLTFLARMGGWETYCIRSCSIYDPNVSAFVSSVSSRIIFPDGTSGEDNWDPGLKQMAEQTLVIRLHSHWIDEHF
jgi:hypothetical protein